MQNSVAVNPMTGPPKPTHKPEKAAATCGAGSEMKEPTYGMNLWRTLHGNGSGKCERS